MTSVTIDEIINQLSTKLNRIFYDREFVGCVFEDLQAIIKNESKCCVLVFPVLSPNYLRIVRYQAKLFDLAVIKLDSGSAKSVGVCHKKFFRPSPAEETEEIYRKGISSPAEETETICKKCIYSFEQMADSATSSRKKRPPIQLYVPPAQRSSSRLSERTKTNHKENTKIDTYDVGCSRLEREKNKASLVNAKRKSSRMVEDSKVNETILCFNRDHDNQNTEGIKSSNLITNYTCPQPEKEESQLNIHLQDSICLCTQDIELFLQNTGFNFPFFSHYCNCAKFLVLKDVFPYAKLFIFSIERINHSFYCSIGWQSRSKNIIIKNDNSLEEWPHLYNPWPQFRSVTNNRRVGFFETLILDFREENKNFSKNLVEFTNTHYLCGDNILFNIPKSKQFYLPVPQYEVISDELKPQDYLHCYQNEENGFLYTNDFINLISSSIILPPNKTEIIDLDSLLNVISNTNLPQMPSKTDKTSCDIKLDSSCANPDTTGKLISSSEDNVIVLDKYIPPQKIGSNSPPIIKDKNQGKRSKHNEHEQEKEIMRKAKQNINRKSRPIIKYIDDDNDTLKIGKGDNINNWEDLFSEDGELQEDIFAEIVQKVGPEVTIVKASEDYSAYASKQVEELEHMVELYDFPPSFETHDIISAFSLLHSDSMYVKWIDDTRALLVLGSSLQAQKAIELANPLIKVRPMSAASRLALEKAHQFDLKPAMKRPQTNLQTARRLITSHLGAKSRVSKEQSAREREDLRLAKEMKKQAKQNERDAWEGNLRSAINST